jgi:hypothetical protein
VSELDPEVNKRLERELYLQLAPVPAPEGLWYWIKQPQRNARPRAALDWAFWPAAVLMALLALGGIVRAFGSRPAGDQSFMAMARTAGGPAYRSGNFDDIRTWVKNEADIDIDLPAGQSGANRPVKLLGARLLRFRGVQVAAIDYRIGAQAATLFVSGKHEGSVIPRMETALDHGIYSWSLRDETYMVSYSGPPASREACMLCHPANMQ